MPEAPVRRAHEGSRLAFCASTGRTATKFVATCLNRLEGVVGLHEGHIPGDRPQPRLSPRVIVHNRGAWHDPEHAARLVSETRDATALGEAAGDALLLADVAYYNAPLLAAICEHHPDALLFVIFRRCEGFVQSATIVNGEDRNPAGWPARCKPLTDWEKFISLGRLKPEQGHPDHASWSDWSGIQRNIWLWTTVNRHLHEFASVTPNCHRLLFESLVDDPAAFWTGFLEQLGIFSSHALAECVGLSKSKINRRDSYQIGGAESWTPGEQALYAERACPLEAEIYG